ncbi:hypothetical protein LCGC14_1110060 [marine sediment metagenome]|uniref:Uncharacterized protein n=1 Tax=marine sediment metagenome TaxID=412755 RepID=A0A0F9MUY8_9ZZZZ
MNWSLQRVLTRELIEDGAKLPKGYGFAWRDFDTASHVAYPIPFNVLFRGLRRFYHWVISHKNSVLDEARIAGIREGQNIQRRLQLNQQQAARKLLK